MDAVEVGSEAVQGVRGAYQVAYYTCHDKQIGHIYA